MNHVRPQTQSRVLLHRAWSCFSATILFSFSWLASSAELDLGEIRRAANGAHSLFLDSTGRVSAIDTFLALVKIKGPSGEEQLVVQEITNLLKQTGARVIPAATNGATDKEGKAVPHNLVMELPESTDLGSEPGILLNGHIDTINRSTPDGLAFEPDTLDFYHADDKAAGKISSFGGDDRSAVAGIVESIRVLHAKYWSRGVAHRRIVLAFTAQEEVGCLGAKYLSQHQPELFRNLKFSLSMDGPLDLRSRYPDVRFVVVRLESDRAIPPYRDLLNYISQFCARAGMQFEQTEYGLGMGDFASFAPEAHAGLHVRSPVRGWHNHERVNLQDQLNHVDLLCHILLAADRKIPEDLPKQR